MRVCGCVRVYIHVCFPNRTGVTARMASSEGARHCMQISSVVHGLQYKCLCITITMRSIVLVFYLNNHILENCSKMVTTALVCALMRYDHNSLPIDPYLSHTNSNNYSLHVIPIWHPSELRLAHQLGISLILIPYMQKEDSQYICMDARLNATTTHGISSTGVQTSPMDELLQCN